MFLTLQRRYVVCLLFKHLPLFQRPGPSRKVKVFKVNCLSTDLLLFSTRLKSSVNFPMYIPLHQPLINLTLASTKSIQFVCLVLQATTVSRNLGIRMRATSSDDLSHDPQGPGPNQPKKSHKPLKSQVSFP